MYNTKFETYDRFNYNNKHGIEIKFMKPSKKTADGKLYAAPYWSHLYCLKTKQVTREPNQRWYEWLPALHRAMSDEGADLPIIEECIHYENMFFEGQIEVKYEEENDGELVEDAGPGF